MELFIAGLKDLRKWPRPASALRDGNTLRIDGEWTKRHSVVTSADCFLFRSTSDICLSPTPHASHVLMPKY